MRVAIYTDGQLLWQHKTTTHGLKSIFHIRSSIQLDQSFVLHCTVSLRVC